MRYIEDTKNYWSTRADVYTKCILPDFEGARLKHWLRVIDRYKPEGDVLKILDAGCGPGYFSIILAQQGHEITAVDYTPQMLAETQSNAEKFGVLDRITILRQDIQNLTFVDNTFDMVISRNVTWTLDDPEQAYRQWLRVLKPSGCFLNFDSNFLFAMYDEALQKQYKEDEKKAIELGYIPEPNDHLADGMDQVLPNLTSAKHSRPAWDMQVLAGMDCSMITLDKDVYRWQMHGDYRDILGNTSRQFMIYVKK